MPSITGEIPKVWHCQVCGQHYHEPIEDRCQMCGRTACPLCMNEDGDTCTECMED